MERSESGTDPLVVALVQHGATRDPAENIARLTAAEVPRADLVVWPEATQRDLGGAGDDLSADAEPLDGPFVEALVGRARRDGGTWVAGMIERSDEARPYNTLVVADRDGLRAAYRKIHLYDSFGYKESERLLAGEFEPVVVDVEGWPVGLMTCYDLRFPELSRALVAGGADVLLCPAAWLPGPRKVDHWRTLVTARAIENVSYVVAVGQPGPAYCGSSMAVDPRGDVVVAAGDGEETATAELSRGLLEEARRENPSLSNRRDSPAPRTS